MRVLTDSYRTAPALDRGDLKDYPHQANVVWLG